MAPVFKSPDQLADSLGERFKYDANKYPLAKPHQNGYKYNFDNGREIIDNDAFVDSYLKNYPNSKNPLSYLPKDKKFEVSNAGKRELFPSFDEAYKFATETPIKNPFELSDDLIPQKIRPARSGSMSQEVGSLYENLSDLYGIDFDNLIYGEEGFEKKVRPNLKGDFNGDVVYSEKLWNELDKWFKQNTGQSLRDRLNYVRQKRKELYGDSEDYRYSGFDEYERRKAADEKLPF